MVDKPTDTAGRDAPLNPALRRQHDRSYGADHTGTDPMETVSKKGRGDGDPWPLMWAAVVILGVIATIVILFL